MVDRHVAARGISDPRILQAMREVPRHLFVAPVVASKAYGPGALPIGASQTISQPYIVARMIELLDLSGSKKVLEVGTGTGYQAVVLSKLAAKVFSIERVSELALRATELIKNLKISNISVKVFDGTYGWSDQAPFDRIIIAAAVLSTIVGAVVAYLVLTVPNDLQAAALMKTARRQIAAGDNDHARESLSRIVQQY